MQADLRTIPSTNIWYCYGGRYYQGLVTAIRKEGTADILVFSNEWGDTLERTDVPYGREKERHWYFRDVDDTTILLLENLGVQLTEAEKHHAYHYPHTLKHEEKKTEVEDAPEFVQKVVTAKLEDLNDNNGHSDPTHPARKPKTAPIRS